MKIPTNVTSKARHTSKNYLRALQVNGNRTKVKIEQSKNVTLNCGNLFWKLQIICHLQTQRKDIFCQLSVWNYAQRKKELPPQTKIREKIFTKTSHLHGMESNFLEWQLYLDYFGKNVRKKVFENLGSLKKSGQIVAPFSFVFSFFFEFMIFLNFKSNMKDLQQVPSRISVR